MDVILISHIIGIYVTIDCIFCVGALSAIVALKNACFRKRAVQITAQLNVRIVDNQDLNSEATVFDNQTKMHASDQLSIIIIV